MKTVLPLLLLLAWPAQATEVTVDASRERKAISDDLYGLIGGEAAQLSRMGVTVRRHGGNTLSRYNWKSSATNTGGDIHFFQIKQVTPANDAIAAAKAAGVQTMIEIPLLGGSAREVNRNSFNVLTGIERTQVAGLLQFQSLTPTQLAPTQTHHRQKQTEPKMHCY